ncbi:hypothetical protein C2G38_2120765 [Gigaspora rosea]|uniref:PAS domain-containing protein n=1 Tax=Gigaspora rosea TaxID=44941 RepID=A0A397U2G5_9GLOM|nr:hypothetical protein C2G38_2120765 [Gigaspora rosea]
MSSPLMMLNKSENSNFIDMVYNFDWSSTPLGPIDTWDPALKNATNLCLKSELPISIYIDPSKWIMLYNKAFASILKSVHPALGKQFKEVWPERYDTYISLDFNKIVTTGKGLCYKDLSKIGQLRFSNLGIICALWCLAQETTQNVLNTRRLKLLGEFGHFSSSKYS